MKKILGLGHPRTGTGYTAKLLSQWGLNVGHEIPKSNGVVGWQYTFDNGPYPFIPNNIVVRPQYKTLIYNVRDPLYSIPSIAYTENNKENKSYKFRCKFYKMSSNNKIENAIDSITWFDDKICSLDPAITYKIENEEEALYNFLFNEGYKLHDFQQFKKDYNKREHKSFLELLSEEQEVSSYHIDKINLYCKKYNYPAIDFSKNKS